MLHLLWLRLWVYGLRGCGGQATMTMVGTTRSKQASTMKVINMQYKQAVLASEGKWQKVLQPNPAFGVCASR